MTFEQLRRTAVILVCVLLVVAFASARTLSPNKPAVDAGPPLVDQVITYYQPEQRSEDPSTAPPLARPIELALAEVRPKGESAPAEQVPLIRKVMIDPPATTGQASTKKPERDPVCGAKGRRYFKLNGRQFWRCIR